MRYLVVLLIVLVLAACGSTANPPPANPADDVAEGSPRAPEGGAAPGAPAPDEPYHVCDVPEGTVPSHPDSSPPSIHPVGLGASARLIGSEGGWAEPGESVDPPYREEPGEPIEPDEPVETVPIEPEKPLPLPDEQCEPVDITPPPDPTDPGPPPDDVCRTPEGPAPDYSDGPPPGAYPVESRELDRPVGSGEGWTEAGEPTEPGIIPPDDPSPPVISEPCYPTFPPPPPDDPGGLVGSWGGEHIALEVTTSGARIAYDCAYGSIHEPLRADEHGSFDVLGVHVREHGGPVREGEPLEERPARYTGWVTEGEMTLTVTLTDTGQQVGTFTLRRGEPPRVYRCL